MDFPEQDSSTVHWK